MRLSAIRWLRHHMEHVVSDEAFNMSRFCTHRTTGLGCETVGCMAGQMLLAMPSDVQDKWIAFRSGLKLRQVRALDNFERVNWMDITAYEAARINCGLTPAQGKALFAPSNVEYGSIDRSDAVLVLSCLERVHQINWAITLYHIHGYQPVDIPQHEITR